MPVTDEATIVSLPASDPLEPAARENCLRILRGGAAKALGFRLTEVGKAAGVDDGNAGMGIALGDYDPAGRPSLFVTNSRGQLDAAIEKEKERVAEAKRKAAAKKASQSLGRRSTWCTRWRT